MQFKRKEVLPRAAQCPITNTQSQVWRHRQERDESGDAMSEKKIDKFAVLLGICLFISAFNMLYFIQCKRYYRIVISLRTKRDNYPKFLGSMR